MNIHIDIPPEWHNYYNKPAFFITYFGEIYFGTIWELHGYDDRFFIVQNDKTQTLRNLKQEEKTLLKYQELGREIKDIRVIKRVVDENIDNKIVFKELSHTSNQQFKKMFVFGAAASTYCVFGDALKKFRESNFNPPTGLELFDEKYENFINQYPGAKLSVTNFESKDKDVEGCLEEDWQVYKSYYIPDVANRHVNIQFYLKELFTAISKEVVEKHYRKNLYLLLLHKLQNYLAGNPKEKVSFVSFNYDTILDDFISQLFQIPYNDLNNYIDYDKYKVLLFKPHGSCDWGWRLKKELLNGHTNETIAQAIYEQNFEPWQIFFHLVGDIKEVIAMNTWGHEYANDKYNRGRFTINKNLIKKIPEKTEEVFFPSLLLPYRDKDEMIMPYDHFNVMSHVVIHEVEELYLIGWKGNEDLFNRQFKNASKLKRIIIVNPEAGMVKCNLSKHIDLNKVEVIEVKNFETFVMSSFDKLISE